MHRPREVIVSGTKRLDLTVARRGRLLVHVVDPGDDAALEGVNLYLVPNDEDGLLEATTDADGVARFSDLKAGIYRARIETPPGYRAKTAEHVVALAPGEQLELDFELERSGVVRGRVVDEDTQEPLVGVTVRLYNATGTIVREAVTVADGVYEFTNLPEDRYEVEVDPA